MDVGKRNALLRAIGDIDDPSNYAVYVSAETFFDGNDDLGSLWCNVENPPKTMTEAFTFIETIRSRSDVNELRVCVTQFDDGEDEWPFSDTILVVTDASDSDVKSWFDAFPLDEISSEEDSGLLAAIGHPGKAAVRLWWD